MKDIALNSFPPEKAIWYRQKLPNLTGAGVASLDLSNWMAFKLVSLQGFLSTSAVVSNRRPVIATTMGDGTIWTEGMENQIAAGETRTLFFSRRAAQERDNGTQKWIPIDGPILVAPLILNLSIAGNDAADTMILNSLVAQVWLADG